jgi:acyl transferase domain-containing protein/acyl carrier protein
MSDPVDESRRALLEQALAAIDDLQSRLDAAERARREPVAIVGMSCRFPRSENVDAYWRLLRDGVDAVAEAPRSRWEGSGADLAGGARGGFIDRIDEFDPAFFGITPREAATMDPQQRLVLEVAWEALEAAGCAPDRLAGSKTGVFVGITANDYGRLLSARDNSADMYLATGNALNAAAGRLAFTLGLQGPSMAVDTACSSSLVAVHLACQSLRNGESSLAIAGGVNAILMPDLFALFKKWGMVAPDGRCKTFDAAADGFVRGEGCGMVVLKRLSDAVADRDRVLAVIRGSAVNQDGHSSGLTVPNGLAQQRLIKEALAAAGVRAADVDYVEAHGTGTTLGDPIEAEALGEVFRDGRAAGRPLLVGSVKTNIGHLESASGVAGLIKVVLALQHGLIPPHLHFRQPNPRIAWKSLALAVPTGLSEWPETNRPRLAGVSSFGLSGTNAHVVVEQAAAEPTQTPSAERPLHVLTVSARSANAVRQLATDYSRVLAEPSVSAADIAFTANAGRASFAHRAAIVGSGSSELRARLDALASGGAAEGVWQSELAPDASPKVAFLFSGQGAQHAGMGRLLFDTQPTFRRVLTECADRLGVPLLDLFYSPSADATHLDQTAITQPALFAFEYALAELWRSWGIVPGAVLGHSVGEYVAACVAGVLGLDDALMLVRERGRLMQELPAGGAMTAVLAGEDEVARAIARRSRAVVIAAVNAPRQVVIAGPRAEVDAVSADLAAAGLAVRPLAVSHAFHSPLLEPMLDAFEAVAARVTYAPPRIRLVSNVTGSFARRDDITAAYWRQHARNTVRFRDGIKTLDDAGYRLFLEVGPRPVLLGPARETVTSDAARWLASLRPPRTDWSQLLESLATMYLAGATVDWAGFDHDYSRRKITSLPTYPFERRRHWVEVTARRNDDAVRPAWTDWLYELAWQPLADGRTVSLARLHEDGHRSFSELYGRHGLDAYVESRPQLDRLCGAYVVEALAQLGVELAAGRSLSRRQLIERHGAGRKHARLIDRMLAILAEEGLLRPAGEEWTIVAAPPAVPAEQIRQDLARQFPTCAAEIALLARCGANLAATLQGRRTATELLFPDGDTTQLEAIYRDAPAAQAFNALVADTVRALAVGGEQETVRILEIGAGTGGTTAAVLPLLDSRRTEYVYTDVSAAFLARGQAAFGAYRFVEYQTLDIARDPIAQGFPAESFDIVIAANVLHATPDLRATVGHVQQLLRPGGALVLLEGTSPQRLIDLTFGLTEGWWAFTDVERRPAHALLSGSEWARLFGETGFAESTAVPEAGSADGGLAVMIARRASQTSTAAPAKRWLVFADAGGAGDTFASLARARGDWCRVVRRGSEFVEHDDFVTLDPVRPEHYQRLLSSVSHERQALHAVVHMWALDEEAPAAAADVMGVQERLCGGVVSLVQALVRSARPPRLTVITRGAQQVATDETVPGVAQAGLWGLGRIIALEHPELRCVRVDLDPVGSPAAGELAAIFERTRDASADDDQLARRGGQWRTLRLAPSETRVSPPATAAYPPNATYLITGGLAGIGLRAAERMVEQGARHLLLVGRSAPHGDALAVIERLRQHGADVRIVQGDVADRRVLADAIARIDRDAAPLRGIVHSAGTLDDGVLLHQSWPRFRTVLAAKVEGAWTLHQLSLDWPIDFFALFSSASAVLGSAGQANHAAANAFMDALARHRRAAGLPAVSINWGVWSEIGAAARRGIVETMKTRGVGSIDPASGIELFERFVNGPVPQIVVVPIAWSEFLEGASPHQLRFFEAFRSERPSVSTARAKAAPAPVVPVPGAAETAVPEKLRAMARSERWPALVAHVREQVGAVVGLDASTRVNPKEGFRQIGIDSLMALELRGRLQRSMGKPLPATLAFDHPNIDAMARYLASDVLELELEAESAGAERPAPRVAAPPTAGEPIAIVGIGCRFPGADGPEGFWQLLRDGVDAVREVPGDRWNVDDYYDPDPEAPGKMNIRSGAFLDRIDQFDPQFFGIAPREAISMDPQQRLLLEVTWEALENAGCAPDRLTGSPTGVFVGIQYSEYAQLQNASRDGSALSAYTGTGTAVCVAAGRLSYVLGLQGPSLSVNTACSSSLVAIHLASQSLRNDECRMAVAGGVSVILSPETTVILCKTRMLSPSGRCKTFDAAADGFARGEGCGMVVLKRLSDAQADGDRILAVIRGTALNQDGRSSGLTVPNGPAQEAVIREALARAAVDPREVGYVEAHGTGTELGDPIEIKALGAVLGAGRPKEDPLFVGSVKTNIGHLESAAGIAGLIKVVLALEHEEIPRHLNFHTPNPHIAWSELPIAVAAQPIPWKRNGRRRLAGVSSFGFSGTNAHVVLEEPPAASERPQTAERPVHVLALSARGDADLVALADRYHRSLEAAPGVSLADLCFTANTGRAHFPHRLAIAAEGARDMSDALRAYADARTTTGAAVAQLAGDAPKIAFLFTGQGAQYAGMARQLYATQPTFKAALDECASILASELDVPLLDVLYGQETGRIDDTAYTQPALFAVAHSLTALWRTWGVRPAIVLGHSIGEYVAACAAGVFALEDGLRLIAARGRLMQQLPRDGGMIVVAAGERAVAPHVAAHAATAAVAAVNGPAQVVVAGARATLEKIEAALDAEGVTVTWLPVSHAFHSPLVEPMLDAFEKTASKVAFRTPQLPVVSNVTGRLADGDDLVTASYWRRHARHAVQFAASIETLLAQRVEIALEVGPRPTLSALGRRAAAGINWLPSLESAGRDWSTLSRTISRLYAAGAPVDWAGFDRDYPRSKVALPTYPFQRQRYWVDVQPQAPAAAAPDAAPTYTIAWKPVPRTAAGAGDRDRRTFVLVSRSSELATRLVTTFEKRGDRAVLVPAEAVADLAARLDALGANGSVSVVYVADEPRADGAVFQDAVDECGTLLQLVQALVSAGDRRAPMLRVVTRGAHVVSGREPLAPAHAPLVGLLRAVMNEHPELGSAGIDVDSESDLTSLVEELTAVPAGELVALRGKERVAARLVPLRPEPSARLAVRPDATYLITGGLGALGLAVARWIVAQGGRHLVLVGRRTPSAEALHAIQALEAAGASVRTVAADVSHEAAVANLVGDIARDMPPLTGVVHAAGVIDDAVLTHQTRERFARVLAPKVAGAWNLHVHTQALSLDFFVLFASIAGVVGSPGQSNYAAANAFLDAFASERRRSGLPAVSIDWGPWSEHGMAASVGEADRRRWSNAGVELISTADALRVLAAVAAGPAPQAIVMPVRWPEFLARAGEWPFLAEIQHAETSASTMTAVPQQDLLAQLDAARPNRRRSIVHEHVASVAREVLGLDVTARFDVTHGFRELGMDSLMAVDLRNRLQRSIGKPLPSTLAFDRPTVDVLATYLADEVLLLPPSDEDAPPAVPPPAIEADDLLTDLEELSDAEVDRLLAERMGAGRGIG